jgi:small subunit ribosomal protein S4
MTKRIQAKHKIERRYGVALWGQEGSPVHTRSYPPGQHGPKGARKLTDYGQQLAAKQKLRGYYGVSEKQFRRTYDEAVRRKGSTADNFLVLLECRLDAAVYRIKWVPTVFAARQVVNHCHVSVNGRVVNIPSYRLKEGDIISLNEGMHQNAVVVQGMGSKERDVPEYFQTSSGGYTAKLAMRPDSAKIPYPIQMNVNSIIEFYAR